MGRLSAIDFNPDTGRLWAVVEGYEAWVVEAVVLPTSVGPAIGNVSIYPRQTLLVQVTEGAVVGKKVVDHTGETVPSGVTDLPDGQHWTGEARDVPPGGVPARLIRQLNVGELVALARASAHDEQDRLTGAAERASDPAFAEYLRGVAAKAGGITERPSRRGRRGNGIDHYLVWAVRYSQKVATGSKRPIAELAEEHNEEIVYVRDTVTDARRRHKLLSGAPGQGRAGGQLSERALELLAKR